METGTSFCCGSSSPPRERRRHKTAPHVRPQVLEALCRVKRGKCKRKKKRGDCKCFFSFVHREHVNLVHLKTRWCVVLKLSSKSSEEREKIKICNWPLHLGHGSNYFIINNNLSRVAIKTPESTHHVSLSLSLGFALYVSLSPRHHVMKCGSVWNIDCDKKSPRLKPDFNGGRELKTSGGLKTGRVGE